MVLCPMRVLLVENLIRFHTSSIAPILSDDDTPTNMEGIPTRRSSVMATANSRWPFLMVGKLSALTATTRAIFSTNTCCLLRGPYNLESACSVGRFTYYSFQ